MGLDRLAGRALLGMAPGLASIMKFKGQFGMGQIEPAKTTHGYAPFGNDPFGVHCPNGYVPCLSIAAN